MSDYFSGHRYRQQPWLSQWSGRTSRQQPWLTHWSDRTIISSIPYTFNSYFYYPNLFTVNGGGGDLHHHHYQFGNIFAALPPTVNLLVGTSGRGGAKAYFRFHGGIGDGCCGIACRNIVEYTAARPLQLFDALDPIDFKYYEGGFVNIPMIGPSFLPVEASNGTGVFLPVYPKRIRARKGMHVRGDRWQRCGGRKKQENVVAKAFVVEKEECKDIEEIPVELLLPSEWPY